MDLDTRGYSTIREPISLNKVAHNMTLFEEHLRKGIGHLELPVYNS